MAEKPLQSKRPRLVLRTAVARLLALTLVLTVLIGVGLSLQLAAGRDPALGPKLEATRSGAQQSSAPTTAPAGTPVSVQTAPAPVQTSTS